MAHLEERTMTQDMIAELAAHLTGQDTTWVPQLTQDEEEQLAEYEAEIAEEEGR